MSSSGKKDSEAAPILSSQASVHPPTLQGSQRFHVTVWGPIGEQTPIGSQHLQTWYYRAGGQGYHWRVCTGTLGGPMSAIGRLWVASSYGVWVLRSSPPRRQRAYRLPHLPRKGL